MGSLHSAVCGTFATMMKNKRGFRKCRITGDDFRALPGQAVLWQLDTFPFRLSF